MVAVQTANAALGREDNRCRGGGDGSVEHENPARRGIHTVRRRFSLPALGDLKSHFTLIPGGER